MALSMQLICCCCPAGASTPMCHISRSRSICKWTPRFEKGEHCLTTVLHPRLLKMCMTGTLREHWEQLEPCGTTSVKVVCHL